MADEALHPMIRKLEQRGVLACEERRALGAIPLAVRTCRYGETIVRQGQRLQESTLLLSGFAARATKLRGGKRQFTSVHVAGDFVDLHGFVLKRIDHSIEALTECQVAAVAHADLERVTERFPHLARLLWLNTVIDGAIHRTWLATFGRQACLGRAAHFVCELFLRLGAVGQVQEHGFQLPLTQVELGDVLGMSSIHVNRVIQELRKSGLLTWQDQRVTILDWDRLCRMAEFDDAYLCLEREPR